MKLASLHSPTRTIAILSAVLLVCSYSSYSQTLIGTAQSGTGVRAMSADQFVDSVGVVTHWRYSSSPYGLRYPELKAALLNANIRHVRDGGTSTDFVAKARDLAGAGILTTIVASPLDGLAPNPSYWTTAPSYLLTDFLKRVGPGVIDGVEMPNEIDGTYRNFKWHPSDTAALSNAPGTPNYWANYIVAYTRDTFNAIKADPATRNIRVIGPAMAVSNALAAGSLAAYVDWGAFHPYPYGGNTWNYAQPYDGVLKYFWQTDQPSVNIDEYPYAFQRWAPAFSSATPKPLSATETGYYTGTAAMSISDAAQGKYIPRVAAEYFRHGIPRTFFYELVDESTNKSDRESNFGLLRNNLSPKPGYTALASLLALLKEPGTSFTPDSLAYTVTADPKGTFTRTRYIHDLLLEKSDHTYYLLLWHEASSAALADSAGNALPGTARDLDVPALTTTVTLPPQIQSAILYSYDSSWNLVPQYVAMSSSQITLPVGDSISVLKLTCTPTVATAVAIATAPSVTLDAPSVQAWGHWGGTAQLPNAAEWDRGGPTPSLLSPMSLVGQVSSFTFLKNFFSWSSSTGPNRSTTRANTGLLGRTSGSGFSFTATSPGIARKLSIHVSAYWATGKLTVTDQHGRIIYSDATFSDTGTRAGRTYELLMTADSAVRVQWTVASGSGSVGLSAVTLESVSN